MKKEYVGWLFAVIVLSVLLAVSIFLGVTGYFSSVTYLVSHSDLVVGDNVVVHVLPNQASVFSFTFDGAYLPDETIPHTIQISASNLNADVRVRVKAVVFGLDDVTPFEFVTNEHFEKQADGYYYFDDVLTGGNKITFSNYIIMPDSNDFVSNQKYVVTFVVETLETKFDESIWKPVQ